MFTEAKYKLGDIVKYKRIYTDDIKVHGIGIIIKIESYSPVYKFNYIRYSIINEISDNNTFDQLGTKSDFIFIDEKDIIKKLGEV